MTILDELASSLARLSIIRKPQALTAIGAEVESQTKHLIATEKTDPKSKAWSKWSPGYRAAKANPNNQTPKGGSILQARQHLLNSIGSRMGMNNVYVGSNVKYAAIHQFGDPAHHIPKRTYLGISSANEADLITLMNDFLSSHISRTMQ